MNLPDARREIDRLLAEHAHAKRRVKEERAALAEARESLRIALEAQKIIQDVAEAVQNEAHRQISGVVSRCLEAVFGDDAYALKIAFEKKRGKTEARLTFERGGLVLDDPPSEGGGGQVDVAAFALRLACLVLSRPKKRMLLILDEPFRFVSKDYRPRVCEMLQALSRDMGLQIVMVTHSEEFMAGKVIEL